MCCLVTNIFLNLKMHMLESRMFLVHAEINYSREFKIYSIYYNEILNREQNEFLIIDP
jgi:hypothetical protein